jgi:hypothetical protein
LHVVPRGLFLHALAHSTLDIASHSHAQTKPQPTQNQNQTTVKQYTWMIVIHGIVAWLDAYGIGANDVANAFGTSVGSKTLTLWSAVVIAAIFEFLGAMLLGGNVTKTIAGGIAKTTTFAKFPAVFMFGMLCAETGAMIWILLATYLELPVSTTHSIIGGILGFALVFGGGDAVTWCVLLAGIERGALCTHCVTSRAALDARFPATFSSLANLINNPSTNPTT